MILCGHLTCSVGLEERRWQMAHALRSGTKEINMIKISLVLVSLGIAAAIVLWPKSPAVTATPTAPSISIQELHRLIPLHGLPVQQLEDQSLVYSGSAEQTR
jgi:hypothetical protein